MKSLAKFPRRTSASSGFHSQTQQAEDQLQQQQTIAQNSNSDQSCVQANAMQLTASNGVASVNNSLNPASASTSSSTIVGLLHQNSMNSRQQSAMNNASSPYGGISVQIPSPVSSNNTISQAQPNPSPFQSPTPLSNNPPQTSHSALTAANHMSSTSSANITAQQPPALSGEADPNDSQSAVQKIIQKMMLCNQLNNAGGMVGVGSLGNDVKNVNNVNGILPTGNSTVLHTGNALVGNGNAGFGNMGGGLNGIRAAMGNNNSVMNGRIGMTTVAARDQSMNHHQPDLGNQLLGGLGAVNGFNNLQFDWKLSP